MKVVGILTLWAFLAGSVLISNISYADVHGFKTQAWQDCVRKAQCETIQPKEWSPSEISFLDKTISKFNQYGLSQFINTIQNFGYIHLERASSWYSVGINPFVPTYSKDTTTHAMVLRENEKNILVVTDQFFAEPQNKDPISAASSNEITLLHELAHAYDHERRFSNDPLFQKLAGFENAAGTEFAVPVFKNISEAEFSLYSMKYSALAHSNNFEATKLDREFGMNKGLPRSYSLRNPAEAFADLVAFIYFDESAPSYLTKDLINYIDTHVLNGARAK